MNCHMNVKLILNTTAFIHHPFKPYHQEECRALIINHLQTILTYCSVPSQRSWVLSMSMGDQIGRVGLVDQELQLMTIYAAALMCNFIGEWKIWYIEQ